MNVTGVLRGMVQGISERKRFLAEETSSTLHTPFDRYDGKKHAPYYEMADENGVICYNGVTFVCDDAHGALCLGDMSDKSDVLSIPLSGGGCLKVNRNNKGDLAKAIGMFSPEDIRRIMVALAQDNKIQQMKNEIEDDESSLGESAQSIETTGDTIASRISSRQNDNYFDGAADEVQQAWEETTNETGIDGFGFSSTGKLTHISQVLLKRLLTDKELPVFGNTLETAYDFAKNSLETLQQEEMDLSGKTKEAAEGYRQELIFYRVFVEKLSALHSLE